MVNTGSIVTWIRWAALILVAHLAVGAPLPIQHHHDLLSVSSDVSLAALQDHIARYHGDDSEAEGWHIHWILGAGLDEPFLSWHGNAPLEDQGVWFDESHRSDGLSMEGDIECIAGVVWERSDWEQRIRWSASWGAGPNMARVGWQSCRWNC